MRIIGRPKIFSSYLFLSCTFRYFDIKIPAHAKRRGRRICINAYQFTEQLNERAVCPRQTRQGGPEGVGGGGKSGLVRKEALSPLISACITLASVIP